MSMIVRAGITVLAVKNYMFRVFIAQRHKGHEVEKHKSLCPLCETN